MYLRGLLECRENHSLMCLESGNPSENEVFEQVENLLKHDLDKGMDSFLVDSGLLFSQEEEQMLTITLVELSGVQLQQDGLAVPRDQSFEAVAALFVALYALNFLSVRLYLALPREPHCKVL
ncbi:hypothetical protein DV515_00014170 [Chloebia gouldiae]|uniref:Gasdermin PUB domain-containing protein n=1 Tax=Chloebia gouldiae TaxID=44316 RepID=A0A3L8RZ13_CHLGU|nr:hypothetical protein DV515_00014170 [Chloebia gouldiae]